MSLAVAGDRLTRIYVIANRHKLARLDDEPTLPAVLTSKRRYGIATVTCGSRARHIAALRVCCRDGA